MPLSRLADFKGSISQNKLVIIHCQSGMRSQKAITQLRKDFGFTNLKNLKGGLAAFRNLYLVLKKISL
ncbi:MAG: rhodanese-like domain-containing protein [Spirosomataceae bacterium]